MVQRPNHHCGWCSCNYRSPFEAYPQPPHVYRFQHRFDQHHVFLNVVDEDTQDAILDELRSLLTDEGQAFVAVHRDLPHEGREGRGVWQRYVVLDAPLIRETSGYAIYSVGTKSMALHKAAPSMS